MTFASVDQFHATVAEGDAITQQMVATRRALRAAGYASRILVCHLPPGPLAAEVEPVEAFVPSADRLLLFHLSLGHPALERVAALACPKMLVYHGITPSALLAENPALRALGDLGRAQLTLLRPRWSRILVDSDWNAAELRELGYGGAVRWPPTLALRSLIAAPANETLASEMRQATNVLFVGRYAPSKRQEDLVRAIARLRERALPHARLRLVGNDAAYPGYRRRLEGLAAELGVSDAVDFLLRVDRADLVALYRTATVFACASEHEGFGVPLLEAMAFDVPVVAAAAAAVPETLGGAGLLVPARDPEALASAIERLIEDPRLRSEVRVAQRRRLERLDAEGGARRLLDLVGELEREGVRAA